MSLDKTMFQEQLKALTGFFPLDKVEVNKKMLDLWWPVFRDYQNGDFIRGIISVRGSSRRFPTAGILETAVREARRNREREEFEERSMHHEQVKRQNPILTKPEKETYTQAQSREAFQAIVIGLRDGDEAGEKAFIELSEKYPENKSGLLECAETFRKCRMRPRNRSKHSPKTDEKAEIRPFL